MAARPASAAMRRPLPPWCATSTASCARSARDGFGQRDIALIAQSFGAVLAAAWVHDYAPDIRALVVASPAFSVKLYVPFAKEGIALWQKLKGRFFVNSYVKAKFLTHDPERIASFEADPLITRPIASNILVELYDHAARIVADARAITVPTQLLISGSDWVVRHGPQHEFFVNLGSRAKERHVLPGFFHDTLGERDRSQALDLIRPFLEKQFAAPEKTDRPAPGRPRRLHARRGRQAGLAAGAAVAQGPLLGDEPRLDPHGRLAVVGHEDRHRHRLRFRLDARLCLRERRARHRLHRPHDRPHLPRRHRLARHPPAQAASGRADRQRRRHAEGGRPAGPHARHRRRPWPLCARCRRQMRRARRPACGCRIIPTSMSGSAAS